MKLPKNNIYWECIIPYLKIKEIGVMEYAMNNHQIWSDFNLNFLFPNNYMTLNSNVDSIKLYNPYEKQVKLPENYEISLLNEEMRNWCEKRHLVIKKLFLGYSSESLLSNYMSRWNLLHFVQFLKTGYCNYINISHFYSLTTLELSSTSSIKLDNVFADEIVSQYAKNMSRSKSIFPGPFLLTCLILNSNNTTDTALDTLITSIPSITCFAARKTNITNNNIDLMSKYWLSLSSLELESGYSSDMNFLSFQQSNHQFISFSMISHYSNFTIDSIRSFISKSSKTLTRLSLQTINLTESDLLVFFPDYQYLKQISFRLHIKLSDDFFQVLGIYCKELKSLEIGAIFDNLTDAGLFALCKGCSHIENLRILPSSKQKQESVVVVTRESMVAIANTYRHTLKYVYIPFYTNFVVRDYVEIFRFCTNDVWVNDTRIASDLN